MRLSITSIQNCVFNMGKVLSKYGDDLTRDVLTMEGRFDWGRYDFGMFRRRDDLTMLRFDCKATSVTYRQTDRPRYSVGNNRPHLRT